MNNKPFNLEEFLSPYKQFLENSGISRLKYYEYVIEKLVNLNRPITVLETGTMWQFTDDINQGTFTLIFADLIKNHTGGKLITIDISEEHMNNCKNMTQQFSDIIEYVVSDSITYLESLSDEEVKQIDFIYFDSYDLNIKDATPSQLHHYRELNAVYKRLNYNTYIAVDDNYSPNTWVEWITFNDEGIILNEKIDINTFNPYRPLGKGTLIDHFLTTNGWNRTNYTPGLPGAQLIGYEK